MRTGLIAITTLLLPLGASAQARRYSLDSVAGLRLHNVAAEPATLDGKRGVRVTTSPETAPRDQLELVAVIEGLEFSSGVIEAEIAGAPAPGAGEGARGFVGIAFRLQPDMRTYDAFYLRPTNGRVHDNPQPVLIVNDVKSGASARGGVALWIGPGAVTHFRNVVVTPDGGTSPR